tara:strand:+ start:8327 stop:8485 length:159 start_codon:yes stop_codon:yes gene_type:complete
MTTIAKPACDECLGERFVFPDDVADWVNCPVCNPEADSEQVREKVEGGDGGA